MLHIDPCLSFFFFSLSVLQGKSVRSTSTGWRLRSRRWCWTGRPARASWGPAAWWTASCRRSTPSSSRLTTAAPAPVAPRAKSHTSEWQSAKADRMHECAWVLPHNIKQSGVFAAIQRPDSLVLRRGKQKIKLTSFFIIDIERKLKINYVPCWVSFVFILFIPHLDNASKVVVGK